MKWLVYMSPLHGDVGYILTKSIEEVFYQFINFIRYHSSRSIHFNDNAIEQYLTVESYENIDKKLSQKLLLGLESMIFFF